MNQLKVHLQQTIVTLRQQGWSKRKIARELGLDRGTVDNYLAGQVSKPAIPRTGSESPAEPNPAPAPAAGQATTEAKPAIPRTGSSAPTVAGRQSLCAPLREQIEQALAAGLSVQRIYQDLVAEQKFTGSYDSVWRLARKLELVLALPFRRMECGPGEEAQVDFGQGAWVLENGKRRRPHVLRVVLSHSRKGYCEVVWRQTIESFIRCLENAFRAFGGVPRTTVIDNLLSLIHI